VAGPAVSASLRFLIMSHRPSPTQIGAFVLGALVLAVAGVAVLASEAAFEEKTTFISYFDESVNGLDVGAPVKFKGVPIGQVSEILVRMDLEKETFQVPVLYQIDLEPLNDQTGRSVNLADADVLREQVDEGLRAQLQLESIVTGKLYVELTFVPQPQPVSADDRPAPYPEIPAVLSPMARLGEEASGLVSNLRRFDVNSINENLITFLSKANSAIDELNVPAIRDTVIAAVRSVQTVANSPGLHEALSRLPALSQRVDTTLTDVQALARSLESSVDPTRAELEQASADLRTTMAELQSTLQRIRSMLSTDSGIGYRVDDALVSLADAAEALRVLAVSLERDPGMFIRGKEPPEEQ
jgi:paraquat-inducible protein B